MIEVTASDSLAWLAISKSDPRNSCRHKNSFGIEPEVMAIFGLNIGFGLNQKHLFIYA